MLRARRSPAPCTDSGGAHRSPVPHRRSALRSSVPDGRTCGARHCIPNRKRVTITAGPAYNGGCHEVRSIMSDVLADWLRRWASGRALVITGPPALNGRDRHDFRIKTSPTRDSAPADGETDSSPEHECCARCRIGPAIRLDGYGPGRDDAHRRRAPDPAEEAPRIPGPGRRRRRRGFARAERPARDGDSAGLRYAPARAVAR